VTVAVALAWGFVAALPGVWLARRTSIAARLELLRVIAVADAAPGARRTRVFGRSRVVTSVRLVLGAPRRRRQQRRVDAAMATELPVVVDILGVAVAAGCTPYLAIEHASRYGPPRVAALLRDVLQACGLGQALDDALRDLGVSQPMLRPLADALRTSARLGSPAAPALARLAAEVRADTRRRAEARARTVPVRLCFPLVACVLPAFALLTVVPVVLDGFHG
jgi:Flp pilus assembly protein TadB